MLPDILSGRKIGPYTVGAIVGQGSAASVYKAYDADDQVVAMKILSTFAAAQPEIRDRFQREAEAGKTLDHPGIVPVLESGESGDFYYLIMPFIEGESLVQRLVRKPELDQGSAVDIARQIAEALDYAHQKEIIHRDIKPANILLTADGRARLTDFGIARVLNAVALTRGQELIGTFYYSAPEQSLFNHPIDGRTDLYSLGVLLYQMLTSKLPFSGSMNDILDGHKNETPPLPSSLAPIHPDLDDILLKALAKDPADRFQTGAEFAQTLAALPLEPAPQPVKTGFWDKISRFFRN